MKLEQIILGAGALAAALMTVIQCLSKTIKPWTSVIGWIGKQANRDMQKDLQEVKKTVEEHIRADDERHADYYRRRVLDFNTEILRGNKHTEEDFVEVMLIIDRYEAYCRNHPDYRNNRAVHAIANISRVYDDRLKNNDFLV